MLNKASVTIAKERLKNLIITDRVLCLPNSYHLIRKEIYDVLSKYIEISDENFDIEIYRSQILIHFTGENS